MTKNDQSKSDELKSGTYIRDPTGRMHPKGQIRSAVHTMRKALYMDDLEKQSQTAPLLDRNRDQERGQTPPNVTRPAQPETPTETSPGEQSESQSDTDSSESE